MPELVFIVVSYLDKQDNSRLMKTSRLLHCAFRPYLFTQLDLRYRYQHTNLLSSVEAVKLFSKSVQDVRELRMTWLELAFYHNCLLSAKPPKNPLSDSWEYPESPRWVSPLESARLPQLINIQPMVFLTRFHISLHQHSKFVMCPYALTTGLRPLAALTQVCWILRLNPGLQDVGIHHLTVNERHEAALLALSLQDLTRLKWLDLSVYVGKNTTITAELIVFSCLPPSIQIFKIISSLQNPQDNSTVFNIDTGREESHETWWNSDASDLDNIRKVEDIINNPAPASFDKLEILYMWDTWDDVFTPEIVCDVFRRCPSIRSLRLPLLPDGVDAYSIVQTIATTCPNIRHLLFDSLDYEAQVPEDEDDEPPEANSWLPFDLLKALPAQQMEWFHCSSSVFELDEQEAWSAFQRHSTTLTSLVLEECSGLSSEALQVILTTCGSLLTLEVTHFEENDEFYQSQLLGLQVFHAIEYQWACTKLRSLAISIVILPELRDLNRYGPYYSRYPPVVLSEQEVLLFSQLERLYKQIGKLTELEELNLHTMWGSETDRLTPNRPIRTFGRFPLMLSLGGWNGDTQKLGYLHHLQGLKRLKTLRGSVYADTGETSVTMGSDEADWMLKNWPSLQQAEFFPANFKFLCYSRFLYRIERCKSPNGAPLRISYP
ncbi:hypothetical protein EC991_006813 [Linnemannia zychae]|nr:hypothetical protein EC991_006813 [Linnemannia zychae]